MGGLLEGAVQGGIEGGIEAGIEALEPSSGRKRDEDAPDREATRPTRRQPRDAERARQEAWPERVTEAREGLNGC